MDGHAGRIVETLVVHKLIVATKVAEEGATAATVAPVATAATAAIVACVDLVATIMSEVQGEGQEAKKRKRHCLKL